MGVQWDCEWDYGVQWGCSCDRQYKQYCGCRWDFETGCESTFGIDRNLEQHRDIIGMSLHRHQHPCNRK